MAVSTQRIKISDIRLLNPPVSWKKGLKFEIKINFISKGATDTQNAVGISDQDNNRVVWNESFIFAGDITDNTLLTFTVWRKRVVKKNITIVSCEHRITDLFKQQGDSGPRELDVGGGCRLTLSVEKISGLDVISGMIEQASPALNSLPNLDVAAQIATVSNSAEQVYNDNVKIWVSFIDTFHAFMKVMDKVSEISIYVQVAWSLLSIIPKTIIAKKNRDDKVKELCEKLKDIYQYIMDGERLRELVETQSRDRPATHWSTILSTLVQQTIECAYFLRAYGMGNTGRVFPPMSSNYAVEPDVGILAKNIVKAIGGSVDAKIQAFNDKLDHLMKVMTDSVILETGIITLRISGEITEINELTLLGEVPYDSRAGYYPNKECLPGTRQKLIKEIFEWANNDSSMQILVLSGQAGIGKSAIAHTITKMLKAQNRLGSMFCFSRSYADRRDRLFSTISRNLADGDIMWRKGLVKVIGNDSDVRKKEDVRTQFNELIIKPSQNVATDIGPIVIVVDAIDESGNREERREVLEILFNEWTRLPKNYRLFVTTRPEQDVEDQCDKFNIPRKRMGDIDADETRRDIEAFVSNRLDLISLTLDSIDKNWRNILAKRAEGLFQWAQTACRFVDPTTPRSQLIKKKWEACVSNSSSSLYGLYRQIISNQSEAEDDDFFKDFKTIVGAIITAREPLSITALQNIFDDIEDIESILTPFGSLFAGVHDQSTPVRPVHTSLFDFFASTKDTEENNEYYVDTSNQSRMTLGCLKVMDRMLRFNICQLETSHRRNQEVSDISARVEKAIPLHLSYSCRFWSFHLQSAACSEELVREVRRLVDDNLLYYFEVLSLLRAVERGRVTMREIENWCKDAYDDLAKDAECAWRFGVDFGDVMEESTPHLYLSALPFTPRHSFISRKYLERYPGLLTFDIGQPVNSSRRVGFTHKGSSIGIYMAFAFSPNGRYYATGYPSTFSVWNYITGENEVLHEDDRIRIDSNIVFSFDGKLVYYCHRDGNILVLDMGTKETSMESYGEVIDDECCYCTISSDGCFILLMTKKEAVLCDRKSRRIIKRFQGEHFAPKISPNGDWITLYRHSEKQLYMWNTRKHTQHVVPCYLWVGEDDTPLYFPGKLALTDSYVAFQINGGTIEIRDVWSNTKVTEIQHGSDIFDFCLSLDNQYILIISEGTFSIRRVPTGELISQSHVGSFVHRLGFSYDSKSIALSFFNDSAKLLVQQWDESIEQSHSDFRGVYPIGIRGSYFILRYHNRHHESHLQISDITTINTIIFEVKLENEESVSVFPEEDNVRVAYGCSRGLCLWDEKEGEIIIDGSVRSITALVCLDHYLISAHERIINIWDIFTRKLIHGSTKCPSEIEFLLPVRGARFAIIYGDKAEVRDCESGGRVGETFTFESKYPDSIAVSANREHLIFMSENSLDILDLTGARVSSIPFSHHDPKRRLSLNGRYMAWIDIHGDIKLFDVDTEALLTVPSLDRPVENVWISDDSDRIITASGVDIQGEPEFLNIWDIKFENMNAKTIQCQSKWLRYLVLHKRGLVILPSRDECCHVWDLDMYEVMSTLYNNPPIAPEIERTSLSYKTETLDYALMAWKKASLPGFAKVDSKNWVFGLQSECLFWVPPKMRERLWFPCVMHMPHRNIIKLNFTNFVHGSDWTRCKSENC